MDELAENIILLPLDPPVLRQFGELKADLCKKGRPVGDIDTFIAATALVYQTILVTHNSRHFRQFSALRLEDWRAG